MARLCCVCKSPVLSDDIEMDAGNTHSKEREIHSTGKFCHRECFTCSVCQIALDLKSYHVTQDNNICCETHKNGFLNAEEIFVSALKKFRARSARFVSELNEESDNNDFDQTVSVEKNSSCVCDKHQFVKTVYGYWTECTSSDCPKKRISSSAFETGLNTFCDLGASGKVCTHMKPEEIYQQYFYGSKHWNYCVRDKEIGPVVLTLKQEFRHSRDYFRVMVRSSTHIIHGMLSASSISTNRYNPDEVVQFLRNMMEINLPFIPISTPSARADLLKMDKAFHKEEFKVGVLYMKESQQSEEELFNNKMHSEAFDDFLNLLGERIRLRGFDKYRAGLDNVGDLTGTHSVYTTFKNNQIMFHISTLLPFEANDAQKLQRKRHIGNDIVCIIFMEAKHTQFIPGCIKSNFLHTFIIVQVDTTNDPETYTVSVVSKDSVPPYPPFLSQQNVFKKGPHFREWLLTKVINGEQVCYRAPKFAKLHKRTRCQIMEDLIKATERNQDLGIERKDQLPFRDHNRWSVPASNSNWFCTARPPSPLQDAVQERFDGTEQLARDLKAAFSNDLSKFGDVIFIVGKTNKKHFVAVRSVLAARSRAFYKMLIEPDTPTYQDNLLSPHQNGDPLSPAPMKRPSSWARSSPLFPAGSRSRKFSFEKFRRAKSDTDNSNCNPVTLSSVTDLQEKAKLITDKRQAWQECVVEEFDGDTFSVLLEYLQTGSCDITSRVLPGLLCAAEHYEVDDLRHACLEHAHECIREDTVLEMLKAIEAYSGYASLDLLKEKVGSFLEQSSYFVLEKESDTCDLSEESLRLVLSRQPKASDVSKFTAIIEWSEHFSKKNDLQVSPTDIAQPLLDEFVAFHGMTPQEYMQAAFPTNALPNDDVVFSPATKADRDNVDMIDSLKEKDGQ